MSLRIFERVAKRELTPDEAAELLIAERQRRIRIVDRVWKAGALLVVVSAATAWVGQVVLEIANPDMTRMRLLMTYSPFYLITASVVLFGLVMCGGFLR